MVARRLRRAPVRVEQLKEVSGGDGDAHARPRLVWPFLDHDGENGSEQRQTQRDQPQVQGQTDRLRLPLEQLRENEKARELGRELGCAEAWT